MWTLTRDFVGPTVLLTKNGTHVAGEKKTQLAAIKLSVRIVNLTNRSIE